MYFNQHETHYNIFPSNIYLFLISQVVAQDGDRTNNELQKDLGKCANFKPRSGHDAEEMHNFVDNLNFEDVQRYVMFLSFARAGHSWIGSVLDAAPNALVANEYGIFETFKKERRNMTRDSLFEGIAKNSFLCGKYGRIHVYCVRQFSGARGFSRAAYGMGCAQSTSDPRKLTDSVHNPP